MTTLRTHRHRESSLFPSPVFGRLPKGNSSHGQAHKALEPISCSNELETTPRMLNRHWAAVRNKTHRQNDLRLQASFLYLLPKKTITHNLRTRAPFSPPRHCITVTFILNKRNTVCPPSGPQDVLYCFIKLTWCPCESSRFILYCFKLLSELRGAGGHPAQQFHIA